MTLDEAVAYALEARCRRVLDHDRADGETTGRRDGRLDGIDPRLSYLRELRGPMDDASQAHLSVWLFPLLLDYYRDPPADAMTGIPKNPGRRDLGMRATLIFPDKRSSSSSTSRSIYTACRTCYSEQAPEEIFRRAVAGDFDPLKMQKLIRRSSSPDTAPPSSTSCSRSRSPACRGRCRTSSSDIAPAWPSTSRASAT